MKIELGKKQSYDECAIEAPQKKEPKVYYPKLYMDDVAMPITEGVFSAKVKMRLAHMSKDIEEGTGSFTYEVLEIEIDEDEVDEAKPASKTIEHIFEEALKSVVSE